MLGRQPVINRHDADAHRGGDRDRLDQRAAARSPHERAAMHVDQDAGGIAGRNAVRGFDDIDGDLADHVMADGRVKVPAHLDETIVVPLVVEDTLFGDVAFDRVGCGRGVHAHEHPPRRIAELVGWRQAEGRYLLDRTLRRQRHSE